MSDARRRENGHYGRGANLSSQFAGPLSEHIVPAFVAAERDFGVRVEHRCRSPEIALAIAARAPVVAGKRESSRGGFWTCQHERKMTRRSGACTRLRLDRAGPRRGDHRDYRAIAIPRLSAAQAGAADWRLLATWQFPTQRDRPVTPRARRQYPASPDVFGPDVTSSPETRAAPRRERSDATHLRPYCARSPPVPRANTNS